MRTHQRWRESLNEKMLTVNALQEKFECEIDSANNHIKRINFHCSAPGAKTVHLVGDFNHRHPILMEQQDDDCWFIQIWLPFGHYHYRFLVDGKPMLDPRAAAIAQDEHNKPVSLIVVS